MKKNNQQRLILNIIILVISAFILIFMLLGKFLSPSDTVYLIQKSNNEVMYVIEKTIRNNDSA
ncbi:MAG: hypothetical protein ACJAS9_001725 [Polaribacter sp.]|jgi:hypothetical protein